MQFKTNINGQDVIIISAEPTVENFIKKIELERKLRYDAIAPKYTNNLIPIEKGKFYKRDKQREQTGKTFRK